MSTTVYSTNAALNATALDLPMPRLVEGRFSECAAFTDDALEAACGVRIAFLERAGGVSAPPYDTLNLGLNVEDDFEDVAANRRRAARALGAGHASIIQPLQVHGSRVVTCASPAEVSSCEREAAAGADAVVVGCDDVAGLLCFADCVPLIAVSPTGHFAVIHAGWRGVVGGVWRAAIERLSDLDDVDASALNVYIGPYIHACCFEVGPDVRDEFARTFGEGCLAGERHVDMGAALRIGLLDVGVDGRRIADVDICTSCEAGMPRPRFFSHRASGGRCGRHGAFAVKVGRGKELV